ncbi:thiol reductant ABC exporter subunit CydC [Thauera butanivorans]|uniref:thiol reductant ABC exporter subunit CydC n=1 Tax=Thauera butanivorans TaxID=86174 RepID=UPI003AB71F44
MKGRKPSLRRSMKPLLHTLAVMAGRRLWLGGALLAALTVLMGMALLGLSGWFIAATALAGLVPATALMFDVFMPSAGIRLLALGRSGARYAERLVTHDATLAVLAALREKLFRHWSRPQAARLLLLRPARLLQRLTADVDALDNLYLRLLVPGIAALGAALLAALAFGIMRWWLGLLTLAWLLLAGWGIALWHGLRTRKTAIRRAMALETLRLKSVDLVAGQAELLMTGRLPAQVAAVQACDARAAQADDRLYRAEACAAQAYGLASALTLSAALPAMGWLVEGQRIGVAVAALGILLALSAMEPFAALRRGAAEAGRSWLAVRRLGAAVAADDGPPSAEREKPAGGLAVQLDQLRVAHPGWPEILGPLDLHVREGERIALIGSSGAGKSSLLSVIAGELPAASGRAAALPCCWMTQRTELFRDSLRDNLRLASPDAGDAALWNALEAAGLARDIKALPQGLDTLLGEGGLGLSGGQARRLALARLFLHPSRCWLLDEATEGLDAVTAADVMQRLAQAAQGRTLLLATHWQREARLADRIIWLADGRIARQAQRGTREYELALARLRPDAAD